MYSVAQQLDSGRQPAPQPELSTVKAKMKATWEDGDYAGFARYMAEGAVEILEGWGIEPGQRLLDVGCGSGQSAIPAAMRGHLVTGIDIAENLVEHARKWARLEGLEARFDAGDAEDLPYPEDSFDVVISMIGAMFAPRPDQVVTEFARVLRPGGKLYMANWTPRGMPAQMFKCIATHVPPPPGFIPPVLWGDEETVEQRLREHFTDIRLARRLYPQWHYPFGIRELVRLFRTHFGPVKRAFESIDEHVQQELHQQLEDIYASSSEIRGDSLTVTNGEYLEVIATRR
jgi:ubiquinone/menaquinone biosynthesis C-methylase UbiE